MGMWTRMTEAAEDAIAEIEEQASLPRPAEGAPESPDTHPPPPGRRAGAGHGHAAAVGGGGVAEAPSSAEAPSGVRRVEGT